MKKGDIVKILHLSPINEYEGLKVGMKGEMLIPNFCKLDESVIDFHKFNPEIIYSYCFVENSCIEEVKDARVD